MKTKIVRDMTLISLFSALIAITSFIAIPIGTLPVTLQTFGVFATLILLGGRRGSISVAVYIALGAVGLPVFSGFSGGLGRLFDATGGFIFGFLAAALVYWLLSSPDCTKRGSVTLFQSRLATAQTNKHQRVSCCTAPNCFSKAE